MPGGAGAAAGPAPRVPPRPSPGAAGRPPRRWRAPRRHLPPTGPRRRPTAPAWYGEAARRRARPAGAGGLSGVRVPPAAARRGGTTRGATGRPGGPGSRADHRPGPR
ncbi:hypothetical protein B5D80_09680 [Micromonospora wenchangensis]|uniref:Uncharacterized protein n=1 Tax=Micromonospora wenchangensis TaxID=1185415 RepID=A0A246RPC0_9ACTN|nr:hypothetical protein B5D80_09680 [Micromonospora wenchangensis]